MSLNLVNAFTFVFKEKNWFVKILIGSILLFFLKVIALSMDIVHSEALPRIGVDFLRDDGPSTYLILILLYFGAIALITLSIWMHSMATGYLLTTVRRYMRSQDDAVPDWDEVMGKLFKRGFKAILAFFIITSGLGIFSSGIIAISTFWMAFSPFFAMLISMIALFIVVYVSIMIPALIMSFCEKDRFVAAFDFIRARQLALKSIWKYLLMLIMLVVVLAIFASCIGLLFFTKIGILILPIISFYLSIVLGNIIAQYYVAYCKE